MAVRGTPGETPAGTGEAAITGVGRRARPGWGIVEGGGGRDAKGTGREAMEGVEREGGGKGETKVCSGAQRGGGRGGSYSLQIIMERP